MIISNFNTPRILIAPLDWGLGHTTRCIPIIKAFLANNCRVLVACNAQQQTLLHQEFNNIEFLFLEGYNIKYASNPKLLFISILRQLPTIRKAIQLEHQWLDETITNYNIDLVISDNRYGLCSGKIPCIFITHQLSIKAPFLFIERWLQKINYQFINRYKACWVPDFSGYDNIAGILSHPTKKPAIPVHYIGPLARFNKSQSSIVNGKSKVNNEEFMITVTKNSKSQNLNFKYDYCILLSGPEPQRTVLEKMILTNINNIKAKILLVRGKPGSVEKLEGYDGINIKNHLVGHELQQAIQQSEFIISRSGYTTIMELLVLQKKAILIPTPGQTEQEYLGKRLMNQSWCYSVPQQNFNLQNAISKVKEFNYELPSLSHNSLQNFIANFLQSIFK